MALKRAYTNGKATQLVANGDVLSEQIDIQSMIKTVRGRRFEITICDSKLGSRRKLSYVFTEQGITMLSSVLRSPMAIDVNMTASELFNKTQA
jgi:hypothetical protein